jgi:hypothetical protein
VAVFIASFSTATSHAAKGAHTDRCTTAGSSLVRQDGSTVVAGDITAMAGTDTPQVSVQGSRQNAAVTVKDTGASLSEI